MPDLAEGPRQKPLVLSGRGAYWERFLSSSFPLLSLTRAKRVPSTIKKSEIEAMERDLLQYMGGMRTRLGQLEEEPGKPY